jgi:peptide/nickel transport system ATP-binding protein
MDVAKESDQPVIISLVGESAVARPRAKVVLRLLEPTSGSATHDHHGGQRRQTGEANSSVQPIFQNPFEAFSSYRTVDSYLERTTMLVNNLSRGAAVGAMEEALTSVGLKYADVKGKYPNQFSGGELQRVSVARALIPHPKIIIADEPVSMIDASLRMNVINLFLSLKQTFNTSFLYITHDLATAYYISDYIAVMYRGCIVEFGQARAVLTDPQHLHTKLLLESIPSTKQKWAKKQFEESDIETKEYRFVGCKFHNRCPLAQDICIQTRPPAVKKTDGRDVYCHFAK